MLTSDIDLPPERKIKKARINLIRRDPFFGGLSMRLKPHPISLAQAKRLKTRTMATDGRFLFYYPKGIAQLPFLKLVTIIAHESGHIGFKHHMRRGSRNFRLWNRAGDIVVNNILRKAGYDMPQNGVYRHDLEGMSAERVYNILLKEREAEREKRRQEMEKIKEELRQASQKIEQGGGEPGGTDEPGDEDNENTNESDESDESDESNGPDESDEPDDSDDSDDSDEDKDEDEEDEYEDQDGSEMDDADDWEDEFNQDTQPDTEGNFQIDPDLLEDPDGIDALPEVPDLPDELMDGVVLDAPQDMTGTDAEQEIDLAIESAYNNAKNAGRIPGALQRLIESQRKHKIDYRELLRDWLDQSIFPGDYSWKRPNRRYLQYEMILPGLAPEHDMPNVVFVCDASGSVDEQSLRVYSREISGVLEEFPCEFDVIYHDTYVRHTQHFETDDLPIKLEAHGGGGTKFAPVFQYIRDHYPDAEAVLYFTDMGAWDWNALPELDPGIPVLWMNTDRGRDNFNVPFGTVVPIEIDTED